MLNTSDAELSMLNTSVTKLSAMLNFSRFRTMLAILNDPYWKLVTLNSEYTGDAETCLSDDGISKSDLWRKHALLSWLKCLYLLLTKAQTEKKVPHPYSMLFGSGTSLLTGEDKAIVYISRGSGRYYW